MKSHTALPRPTLGKCGFVDRTQKGVRCKEKTPPETTYCDQHRILALQRVPAWVRKAVA